VAGVWRYADPERQTYVAEAQAAIRRLAG